MKRFLILCPLIFLLSLSSRADQASGNYFLDFTDKVSIWDVSGDYEDTIEGFTFSYTISADPRGRFSGIGEFTYEDENGNQFDGEFTFKGRMRSSGTVIRVGMTGRMTGEGEVEGPEDFFDATIAGRIRERLEIDLDTLQLVGLAQTRFRIAARGFVHTNGVVCVPDFATDIPLGMDGSWQLTLNVFPEDNNYTGNATIDLSNGAQYSFDLTGRHTRDDIAKLRLKGDEASPQARFSINATAVTNEDTGESILTVQSLTGRLLGQRIRLQTPVSSF